jgi:hypothetical protein
VAQDFSPVRHRRARRHYGATRSCDPQTGLRITRCRRDSATRPAAGTARTGAN